MGRAHAGASGLEDMRMNVLYPWGSMPCNTDGLSQGPSLRLVLAQADRVMVGEKWLPEVVRDAFYGSDSWLCYHLAV